MTKQTDPWEAFWLASELSTATGPAFAAQINDFAPPAGRLRRATYSAAPLPLVRRADALADVAGARCSMRAFGAGPLDGSAVGALFTAFADGPGGRRAWPSAGGLYPLDIYALLLDVDHSLHGRAVHYEPDLHGLTDVAASPSWSRLVPLLSAEVLETAPQLVVLFVLDTELAEARYGNRAGRFALIEVGHAAHGLALRLAAEGLAGVELGGAHDRALLDVLGLADTPMRLALAYACGRSANPG